MKATCIGILPPAEGGFGKEDFTCTFLDLQNFRLFSGTRLVYLLGKAISRLLQ